jgi:hypothetical protein
MGYDILIREWVSKDDSGFDAERSWRSQISPSEEVVYLSVHGSVSTEKRPKYAADNMAMRSE